LRLFDLSQEEIRILEVTGKPGARVPLRAPIDGVVTAIDAHDQMPVGSCTDVFTIADPSRIWVLAEVFEDQLDWLAAGLDAKIRVPARPGRVWEGRIEYLYPTLDPKTRTRKVRLILPNPDGALTPNMFAKVEIFATPLPEALTIPTEALILTGDRETVVKALGNGRFAPVTVTSGMRTDDRVEVIAGLAEGDSVVVSGQFLIDSEANLKASFARMSDGGSSPAAARQP
jgi:membrane fusion protein, copper/silver efflux system